MDRNLDQDHRQDNKQGPLQKPAMDEGCEPLVIPQLQTEYEVYGIWNTALVNIGSPVLSVPPCKCDPL